MGVAMRLRDSGMAHHAYPSGRIVSYTRDAMGGIGGVAMQGRVTSSRPGGIAWHP